MPITASRRVPAPSIVPNFGQTLVANTLLIRLLPCVGAERRHHSLFERRQCLNLHIFPDTFDTRAPADATLLDPAIG